MGLGLFASRVQPSANRLPCSVTQAALPERRGERSCAGDVRRKDDSSFGQHNSTQQIRLPRRLWQKLAEGLMPFLVLGTTGSGKVPQSGGSEA